MWRCLLYPVMLFSCICVRCRFACTSSSNMHTNMTTRWQMSDNALYLIEIIKCFNLAEGWKDWSCRRHKIGFPAERVV